MALDENGVRLPIGQIECRLVTGTANSFDVNGHRLVRADSGGTGDGSLIYNGATANWIAIYAGLTTADVIRALGAESRGMWLGCTPLPATRAPSSRKGPHTAGAPRVGI